MTNVTGGSGEGGRGDHPRRPTSLPNGWVVERVTGGAGTLLAQGVPDAHTGRTTPFAQGVPDAHTGRTTPFAQGVQHAPIDRTVRIVSVDRPLLVLGSTQSESIVDHAVAAQLDVDVVRRRSGGGAVLLRPGEMVWVDVLIPAGDPLWQDDVSKSFWWLGEAWAAALGVDGAVVHRQSLACSAWSRLVCFGGVGSGEVTVGDGKLVGMASRRSRAGALFQCAVPLAWNAADYVRLLGLPAEAQVELDHVAYPLAGWSEDEVVDPFLAALPTSPRR